MTMEKGKWGGGEGGEYCVLYSSLVFFIFLQYNVMHTCDKYRNSCHTEKWAHSFGFKYLGVMM